VVIGTAVIVVTVLADQHIAASRDAVLALLGRDLCKGRVENHEYTRRGSMERAAMLRP
jgi:hypothetical protein